MSIPAIIMLVLAGVNLGISITQHGKIETKEHNFWLNFIAMSIQLGLLYWGGFFQ